MLVLTRRSGESIVIGDSIRIQVGRTTGKRVKLCIDAPADVRVVRGELQANPPSPSQIPKQPVRV